MTADTNKIRRIRARITGVVQGVGFRPFVYGAANRFGISGFVGNDSHGVFAEFEAPTDVLERFLDHLRTNPPPLATIDSITTEAIAAASGSGFAIAKSNDVATDSTLVSPDVTVCDDCLAELFDESNRRYLYPFINCTNCGPRFTITRSVPYDRPNTTMAGFAMCGACRAEYLNPSDRRFHAQPVSCWECGPQAWFESGRVTVADRRESVAAACRALAEGRIVAVKGIGGFHLACDARNADAVAELRRRKGRVDKPFAVMCRDAGAAARFVSMDESERAFLTARERPIVLLRRRQGSALPDSIAPNNRFLGVMLAYSPLHFLLFEGGAEVLVMTSGNLSDEPIVRDNDEARTRLAGLADAFLFHDREICVQCDDSVIRVAESPDGSKSPVPVRRSRGYAPFPVRLPFSVPPMLAVGGELKATFCLAEGDRAFVSQHIGDMENPETLEAFGEAYGHMKRLFRIEPEFVAGDLHPGYLSGRWARELPLPFIGIQHHHAHIASVMAENAFQDDVIGFAFDGTGYGLDGRIWGGEVFAGGYDGFERIAHLRYFPLAGGDASVRKVWRTALGVLRAAGIDWSEDLACAAGLGATERGVLSRQFERRINTVDTSSFGRLFDAAASIAGVRQVATYEAQAAIEFEAAADPDCAESYAFGFAAGEIDFRQPVRDIVADIRSGTAIPTISARFHNGIADLILEIARRVREERAIGCVALSGGCFQNTTLLTKAVRLLRTDGFRILTHRALPPNDGGLALGQAVLAARKIESV